MLDSADIQSLGKELSTPKKIAVLAHVNPDGDAIGSCLALEICLKARGHQVHTIAPNRFPNFLYWMEGAPDIIIYKDSPEKTKEILTNTDIVFCLDFNNLERLEELGSFVLKLPAKKILIDHHPEPNLDGFYMKFCDVESCSTAEIVYRLLLNLKYEDTISPTVVSVIYVGIMTDTNDFRNNCNNPETFEIIADLIRRGIDKDLIHSKVYDNYSKERLQLLGHALCKKMVVLPEYRAAYIALSKKELSQFKSQIGDTEGFVNLPLSIKGVVLSGFFSENPDHIRISFRSKGKFAANELAKTYFNGGGHKNAAGGKLHTSLDEAINLYKQALEEYKDDLLDS